MKKLNITIQPIDSIETEISETTKELVLNMKKFNREI